jgi:hypothetical protein
VNHFPTLSLLFLVLLATVSGTYIGWATSGGQECNTQLSAKIGSPADLCLQTIAINYSGSNSSDAIVPVLVMKPGTSASISILYEPHADKGSGFNPQSKLTSFNIPTAISAISGVPSGNVSFSKGTLLFSQNNWTIYSYTVSASANSSGYFVIIVPFGPTLYPALAVSSEANSLNTSTLSLWGYVGGITTGETAIPSIIVGTSNLTIVNVTIPESQRCMTRACNVIASSQYYEG